MSSNNHLSLYHFQRFPAEATNWLTPSPLSYQTFIGILSYDNCDTLKEEEAKNYFEKMLKDEVFLANFESKYHVVLDFNYCFHT